MISPPSRFLQFLHKLFLAGLSVALLSANLAASQSAVRIRREVSDYARFTVAGNVRPAVVQGRAQDRGAVAASTPMPRMAIHFSMTPTQNAELLQLLSLQQNRHSTQFHHWLTPEQYADRFGLNIKDVAKVTAWLESMGFSNVQSARSRSFVTFDGTAAQAQMAFNTSIHNYKLSGEAHIANANAPELPAALSGMVAGIRGLHDFHPHTHIRPHFTSSISGSHFLVPDDFATIYDLQPLYGNGITGTGRTIAIPGQATLVLSDIEAFQTASGLPIKDPQIILADAGNMTASAGDLSESSLDIEWAGAIAKGASVVYVTSSDVLQYSVPYIIDNNLADVLPITYGACESGFGAAEMTMLNGLFQTAASLGITVVTASGDNGAADCDTTNPANKGLAVDFPASSPYVLAVGGTEFNEGSSSYWNATNNTHGGSAVSYIPETAWNDTSSANGLQASGGGASAFYTKPAWQTGIGVPTDGARDVPDIALSSSPAIDGYLFCTASWCTNGYRNASTFLDVTGGTSIASPTFAAIVAMLDQETGTRQGLVNQNLYALASISTDAFHDITSGSNIVPCVLKSTNCTTGSLGYSAGIGYDQVTGLGSIDAYNIFQEWNADFSLSPSVTSLTVTHGSVGTASIAVKPFRNFTGTVAFSCAVSSTLGNVTCAVPGTASSSGSVTLTVTAATSASAPWWRPRAPKFPIGSQDPLFLVAALLLAISALILNREKNIRAVAVAFTVVLVVGLSSCGSGGSTTAVSSTITSNAESGTVTITGTSGILSNSTTIAVAIN